ncbi:MAG: hypothetical protein HW421_1445 [Ignavibacteria bacterium]|nr:hypothetical protein [Ignavibacteria bacterium]
MLKDSDQIQNLQFKNRNFTNSIRTKLNFILLFFSTVFIILSLVFQGCGDNGTNPSDTNNSKAPLIDSLSKTEGYTGDKLSIIGKNFGFNKDSSFVAFNGDPIDATDYEEWSNTSIRIIVPANAKNSNITVTVNKVKSNAKFFGILAKADNPFIDSLIPNSGMPGDNISIYGKYFGIASDTSSVLLAGNPIDKTNIVSWNNTLIVFKVPANAASGNISIKVGNTFSNTVQFILTASPPKIDKIEPASVFTGDVITITGTDFSNSSVNNFISFNSFKTPSSYITSWTDTQIKLKVPEAATSGNVYVTVAGAKSNGFNLTITSTSPAIDSISPISGKSGDAITIFGTNFGDTKGSSYIEIGGKKPADQDYTFWSNKKITTKIPAGTVSGYVYAYINGTKSNGVDFTYTTPQSPQIDNITPQPALPGELITITGKRFGSVQGNSTVMLDATTLSNIQSWSDTKITLNLPSNAATGNLYITVDGLKSSPYFLSVSIPPPAIDNVAPTSGKAGEVIEINGTNFGNAKGTSFVEFGSLKPGDADYSVWNNTKIKVKIPDGAATGKIYVTVNNKKSNGIDFTITSATAPLIENVSPTTILPFDLMTITGKRFGSSQGSSYVMLDTFKITNGVTSWSDTKITLTVPNGIPNGNKDVAVWVNGQSSNKFPFSASVTNVPVVLIKSGTFKMGNDNGEDWEKPAHDVTITYDYYMAVTEVTQKQWKFVFGSISNPSKFKNDNNPVEQVNWLRSMRYCNKLSVLENRTPCYTLNGSTDIDENGEPVNVVCNFNANGWRLPTEAEWEYACRAGSTGDFSGTGNAGEMGWTSTDNKNNPQEAGLKKPNAWGLYDMHGNVLEWCWDGFVDTYYETSPKNDPRANISVDIPDIIVRGGSFQDGSSKSTSFHREGTSPTTQQFNLGFRIVRKK